MDEIQVSKPELDPYEGDDIPVVDNQGLGDEPEVPIRYTITSYGADYPVDGLVKRLSDEAILVPKFQRGFVWTGNQASRFISLAEDVAADTSGAEASIAVVDVSAFPPSGEAAIDPGTASEETLSYASVDLESNRLVGLTRPAAHPHTAAR